MISFAEVPGLEVSPVTLLLIGLAIGVIAGFIGVGGGFLMTPTLIVLGFPANIAVGTGLACIAGNSVVATVRHRQLGNVDVKLGATMVVGTLGGAELGVRLVNWLKDKGLADEGVLAASLLATAIIAAYTGWETRQAKRRMDELALAGEERGRELLVSGAWLRRWMLRLPPVIYLPHSRIRVSLWTLVGTGFVAGVMSGFIGVGGGFLMGPTLIYLIGIPSHITVGTDLLQIIFTASYGTVRHTMSGNVIIFASFLMLLGASVGTQVGALATRYVSGPAVRLVLALSVGFAALGSGLELAGVLSDIELLESAARGVLFGALAILAIAVASLLVLGVLRQSGRRIPEWTRSFVIAE